MLPVGVGVAQIAACCFRANVSLVASAGRCIVAIAKRRLFRVYSLSESWILRVFSSSFFQSSEQFVSNGGT